MNRMPQFFILMPLLWSIVGCAPTAERVTTYYDDAGNPVRQVTEEVHAGKYSVYGPTVDKVVATIEVGKRETLSAIQRSAEPRPGESSDLSAYKAGQASALTAVVAQIDPADTVRVIYYGKDEYDVQDSAVHIGGDVAKFAVGAGALWKTMDTALEQAGDTDVGDGATYAPNEVHLTGNEFGDGDSIDIPSDSPSPITTVTSPAQ